MQDFLFSIIGRWSYLGLFLVLLAAGLGLPLPEDIPLLASGWLVYHGHADLTLMITTAMIGVMVGDSVLFMMGRRYGTQVVEHRWFRRIAKPWLLEKARAKFEHHGAKIIFAARFMPGLRAVLFLTAGVFKVPYWKFLAIDGAAAIISVPLWVFVGKHFGGRIEEFVGEAKTASYVIFAILGGALIAWIIWEYTHNLRKKVPAAEPHSAPLAADLKAKTDPPAKPRLIETEKAGV